MLGLLNSPFIADMRSLMLLWDCRGADESWNRRNGAFDRLNPAWLKSVILQVETRMHVCEENSYQVPVGMQRKIVRMQCRRRAHVHGITFFCKNDVAGRIRPSLGDIRLMGNMGLPCQKVRFRKGDMGFARRLFQLPASDKHNTLSTPRDVPQNMKNRSTLPLLRPRITRSTVVNPLEMDVMSTW